VAVVTGGARGMGLACVEELAARGHPIGLIDFDRETAEQARAQLTAAGYEVEIESADVTDAVRFQTSIETIIERLGIPTILVNAAGLLRSTRTLDITEGEWDAVIDVSLKGTFFAAKACLPGMIEAGWGRIVNFSSTAGKSVSTLGGVHYTAAKAGVLGLTRALAYEHARYGVCVNAVCPGLIDTPMVRAICSGDELLGFTNTFPIPRLGEPVEVARLVAFLCSDDAAYITGAAIDINGGDLMV
jgi:NAD(P)-dependent dehydrogenase (short-subunit alcohol dehydrogenase family)